MRGFQETVDGAPRPDAELEQRGTEELGGAAGRADREQEPIGCGGRFGYRTGGYDRRPAAIAVGQLAGTMSGPRRVPHRARRTADRLQPVAGVFQQPQHATVPRFSDEVSMRV